MIRFQLKNLDANPDPDFYLMRMRIQVTKMMRIFADRIHNTANILSITSSSKGHT